jgi:hypothetical protein
MTQSPLSKFGGATDVLVAKVVATAAGSISVADAGSREAFLDAWTMTLSAHARFLRTSGKEVQAPVVLVYVPDSGTFAKQNSGWLRRRMLGVSAQDDLAGILAVGTSGSGGCVHPQRFDDTAGIEAAIKEVGLEGAPTIVLTPGNKLYTWAEGINGDLEPFERDAEGGPLLIDLDAIDRELTAFYESVARQTTKWWQDANTRITVTEPEATVQYHLWLFLMGAYKYAARVKMEEKIGNGRSDITIVPVDTSGGSHSAVLELKTLRDAYTPKVRGTTPTKISRKQNTEWAGSGLQQTAAYRDDNQMTGAFLCLYDFCAGNSPDVLEAMREAAERYGVVVRRYWITANHAEHRKDRYPLEQGDCAS